MTAWDASQLLRGLSAAAGRMQRGATRGLGDWGEHVLDEAVRVVPIEEHFLEGSGRVEQSTDGKLVGIGFGSGPSASYAVPVHEDLSARHDPGKQAKYLEIPLQASKRIGLQILSKAVKDDLR